MVVAFLGLAEFVEEEDHGLQAQHQHDSTDEAGRVEGRVLLRGGSRGHRCDTCVGCNCCSSECRGGAVTARSGANSGAVLCGGLRAAAVRGGRDSRGIGSCERLGGSRRCRDSWSQD